MVKKNIIYFVAVVVLCTISFLSGGVGPGRRAQKMESRSDKLAEQLKEVSGIADSLRTEVERVTEISNGFESENNQLRRDIADIRKINERLTELQSGINDANSDIGKGLKEADSGIGKVIEGMQGYIEKASEMETGGANQ